MLHRERSSRCLIEEGNLFLWQATSSLNIHSKSRDRKDKIESCAYLMSRRNTYLMIVFDAPIILSLQLWIHSIPYFCEFVTICRLFHLSARCNGNQKLTENQPHRNQHRLTLFCYLYCSHAPLGNC